MKGKILVIAAVVLFAAMMATPMVSAISLTSTIHQPQPTPALGPIVDEQQLSSLSLASMLPFVQEQIPIVHEQIPVVQKQIPVVQKQIPVVQKQIPVVPKQIPIVQKQIPIVHEHYENFTMLIGEKKCSSTHNSCPALMICWWNYYTSGRPSFIGFSSEFDTYCIKILKEAKPDTYVFQVRYHRGNSLVGPLPLRHKINITVNIIECHNCSILTGVVTDLRGNPVYNAEIYVEKRDYESIDYLTDVTGFYSTCPLRNGTYTVSVSLPSGVNLLDKVLTANITQNATLNITLQCGSILTGKVMDTNGSPVYNAKVSVSGPTSDHGYTDINGTYSIIRLKNGTYSVTITPPSRANLLEQRTNANITECQITYLNSTLQFGGILKGTVTYENGTGIYNARVKASGPSYKSTYTNTTGYYCIVGLLAGNYTVTTYPPSGANLLSNSTTTSVNLEETIIMDLILQRENQPPIASFSYSPEKIVVNEIIAFNASSSYDRDGIITNYEWNFGDGNIMNTTHEIINHFYSSTGNYNVTLTITDNDDGTNSTERTVIVNPNISWNMTISATDQLESVVVGMHPNATDGYDAEYDVFVQTPIQGKVMLILDDIYSTSIKRTRRYNESVTWNLSVEVPTGQATTLSWSVPSNVNMTIREENSTSYSSLELSEGSHELLVTAKLIERLTFSLKLNSGWNMVSSPLIPDNCSVDAIFGSIPTLDTMPVVTWESPYFIPVTCIEPKTGYWVFTPADTTINVDGKPITNTTLNLKAGWNMVGTVGMENESISDIPNQVPERPAVTWVAQSFIETNVIEPGNSAWVFVMTGTIVTEDKAVSTEMKAKTALTLTKIKSVITPATITNEWNLTISATNQLEPVTFGIHPHATNGYDEYFSQTPVQGKVIMILNDIYATEINRDKLTWNLNVGVPIGEITTLTWDSSKIPSDVSLKLDGTAMKSQNSIELGEGSHLFVIKDNTGL